MITTAEADFWTWAASVRHRRRQAGATRATWYCLLLSVWEE